LRILEGSPEWVVVRWPKRHHHQLPVPGSDQGRVYRMKEADLVMW
jgi:hypothetical protein